MAEGDRKRLVITEADLADPAAPVPERGGSSSLWARPTQPSRSLPPVEGLSQPAIAHTHARGGLVGTAPGASGFVRTVQGRNIVAAACGVTAGWAFCEITHFGLWNATSPLGVDLQIGAYTGAVGLFFAVVYAGWEQILARRWDGVRLAVTRAGPWGFGLAFAAGFVAQIVYRHFVLQILGSLTLSDLANISGNVKLYLTRALAWGLFGLGMGIAVAGGLRTKEKVLNGMIGGGVGGALGGVIFHWTSFNINSDTWGRFIGLVVVGLAIGAAIGVVEKARRQAWMHIVGGPMAGKEFILYGERTMLGSSPQCEITLVKDPTIQPFHALITRSESPHGQMRVLDPCQGCLVVVNGQPAVHRHLRSGDLIALGGMQLIYSERTVAT